MSKTVDVDIFVEPNNDGTGYVFAMKEGGVNTSTLCFDKKKDNMKKSEFYKVNFKLHNTGGANLIFSQLSNKVMYATATAGPTGQCPPDDSTFPGFYVDPASYPQDDVLTVINEDKVPQYFSFCLNFVPKGTKEGKGTTYIRYDPIGDNKDGGLPSLRDYSAVITGAIVAAVVIVFAAYELGFFAR